MDVLFLLRNLVIFFLLITSVIAETITSRLTESFFTQNINPHFIIEKINAFNSLECLGKCQLMPACKGVAYKSMECNLLNNMTDILLGNDANGNGYTVILNYLSYHCEQVIQLKSTVYFISKSKTICNGKANHIT